MSAAPSRRKAAPSWELFFSRPYPYIPTLLLPMSFALSNFQFVPTLAVVEATKILLLKRVKNLFSYMRFCLVAVPIFFTPRSYMVLHPLGSLPRVRMWQLLVSVPQRNGHIPPGYGGKMQIPECLPISVSA